MDGNEKKPKTIHLPVSIKQALKIQAATENYSSVKAMIEAKTIEGAKEYLKDL